MVADVIFFQRAKIRIFYERRKAQAEKKLHRHQSSHMFFTHSKLIAAHASAVKKRRKRDKTTGSYNKHAASYKPNVFLTALSQSTLTFAT